MSKKPQRSWKGSLKNTRSPMRNARKSFANIPNGMAGSFTSPSMKCEDVNFLLGVYENLLLCRAIRSQGVQKARFLPPRCDRIAQGVPRHFCAAQETRRLGRAGISADHVANQSLFSMG